MAADTNDPLACFHLGSRLASAGKLEEAIAAFRQAIRIKPDFAEAHGNLGSLLLDVGRIDEAVAANREAIRLMPGSEQAHYNLGVSLQRLGDLLGAIASYEKAIALNPRFAMAHNNLGIVLQQVGQLDKAIESLRLSVLLNPTDATAHNNLANALHDRGKIDEAITSFGNAIRLNPRYANAYYNLGNALHDAGRFDEAISMFIHAIRLKPDSAEAHSNLGRTLRNVGRIDETIATYRQALRINPDLANVHSNLVFAMQFHPGLEPKAVFEEHRRWNQRHAEPLRKSIPAHGNNRDPERRLRIGYISPDFRHHSLSRFILPLFRYHNHREFEIVCYSDVANPDTSTDRLRACTDRWENVLGLTDERLADKIRQDQIDILIDLAGHTAGNRLRAFAFRPAPVQATYLGYPGSSGLSAMDYRLTDALSDPPGQTEQFHSEKVWRLPICNWCFNEPEDAPEVGPLPAQTTGSICFGSFNNFGKVSELIMEFWARILNAMPASRLLIKAKGVDQPSVRERVRRYFNSRGIAADRLELRGHERSTRSHLAAYNRMDISLDTYPYHGTTTTCEAMWMGVPVVTLAGPAHVSRVGVSLLSNVGLPELIAQSADEYVAIALKLARDLSGLAQMRRTLRDRMRSSPLMDGTRFTRDMEAAYRQMWRTWCEKEGGSAAKI
jgi:protein O-GlcNAc transferase